MENENNTGDWSITCHLSKRVARVWEYKSLLFVVTGVGRPVSPQEGPGKPIPGSLWFASVLSCSQAVYTLARSDDEAVMSAGMKALHNVLLRAQHLEGVDHIFSSTVRDTFRCCPGAKSVRR